MRCKDCQSGYHAPYDRFERLGLRPDGPSFLMKCRQCGALWSEAPKGATLIHRADARLLYPDARL
ncbi:hypothetical protein FHW69_001405 [Luteibacter sp. Sphag1AF]|uniref:hypothetical protein n=1 Tax=Luteibacter sp. Sphag1AF TaxID=2587031 RepID=UPI00160C2275|nr:hypothetical protein [Luteibacter sp. Sphag1AF]MBB3226804.1 hypothetical protein [Luteibacter sp. Sphag1AF]